MLGKILAVVAVTALTIVPAWVQGSYMNRWGAPADLSEAASKIEKLPLQIGEFICVETGDPLSPEVCTELGLSGHLNRTYVNEKSGERITMLLMVGQPGRLVRHPPNICYASLGMQLGGISMLENMGDDKASEFKLLKFKRPTLGGERFVVAFSHTVDGIWSAPDSPRLHFGGEKLLYKMQLLVGEAGSSNRTTSTLEMFLVDFTRLFRENVTST